MACEQQADTEPRTTLLHLHGLHRGAQPVFELRILDPYLDTRSNGSACRRCHQSHELRAASWILRLRSTRDSGARRLWNQLLPHKHRPNRQSKSSLRIFKQLRSLLWLVAEFAGADAIVYDESLRIADQRVSQLQHIVGTAVQPDGAAAIRGECLHPGRRW